MSKNVEKKKLQDTINSNKKPSTIFMQNEYLLSDIEICNNHIETLNNCLFRLLQQIRLLDIGTQCLINVEEMESLSDMLNAEIDKANTRLQTLYNKLYEN